MKQDWATWTISINQRTYIQNMVEKFRLTNAKLVTMPMESRGQFTKEQSLLSLWEIMQMWGIPYSGAIRSTLWPVVILRLDIAFVISILSQFIQNPGEVHREALKHLIVYLGCTKNLWLTFGGGKQSSKGSVMLIGLDKNTGIPFLVTCSTWELELWCRV